METQTDHSDLIAFFRDKPPAVPGEPAYNAAFCRMLTAASSAEEASIWQLDSRQRLHPVYGTNFTSEDMEAVFLREGEGIGGAVILSRQTMAVSQVVTDPRHNQSFDSRIGFQTRSMISAPILFGDNLYGVINLLNHTSGGAFPEQWQTVLSTAAVMYAAALIAAGRMCLHDAPPIRGMVDHRKKGRYPTEKTTVVGVSCPIQEVLDLCVKAARTDISVLILGETGTGKELAARRIHEASPRSSGPFVAVNCAAIAKNLGESELFGHVDGAFTGARGRRQGKFSAADGGTLFLDEIGDMSPSFQSKILRVLQEKKFFPVGSEKMKSCDVRFLAATNQDLGEKVGEDLFREDLYYRICGIEIVMPPLRERPEDIPLLASYFLKRANANPNSGDSCRHPLVFSNQALQLLTAFSWPGNVRQLEQAVLAASTICDTDQIEPIDFPARLLSAMEADIDHKRRDPTGSGDRPVENTHNRSGGSGPHESRDLNRYLKALDSTKYDGTGRWNLSAAARQLGVPRRTFIYRLKKMRLID